MASDITERFSDSSVTYGVIGLGYVGLPLAVEIGRGGNRVVGFDVTEEVVASVNQARSHIGDVEDEDLSALRATGLLDASTDMGRLAECDVICLCVPTPLSKTRDPDISYILAAGGAVAATLRPGQLIVLESTTYPGTTRDVLLPLFGDRGLEVGEDFFLCFSPERVDPGNEVWKTRNTPKVIGGLTPACLEAGVAAYGRFIEEMVPVSSPEAAELVKLLGNTFRAVNIALVNELAQIADRLEVDIWEVVEAAATKPFGFMKFMPGPGLGGHCIPVDPHYLAWKMRTLDYQARFIELASEVNSEMPHFVVGKVRKALNAERKAVNGSRVLVLGVAYKKDVDDIRESPSLDIIRELERDGADVLFHDPHVSSFEEDGRTRTGVELTDRVLESVDVVLLVTDHSAFDLDWILDRARVLVDSRNATSAAVGKRGMKRSMGWIVKSQSDRMTSRESSALSE
jgi:UDP-N-acetyl-D-glucosamine dehydrogenase